MAGNEWQAQVLRALVDNGGRVFDTAPGYGASEEVSLVAQGVGTDLPTLTRLADHALALAVLHRRPHVLAGSELLGEDDGVHHAALRRHAELLTGLTIRDEDAMRQAADLLAARLAPGPRQPAAVP